jgi:hypothetical protein
LDDVLQSFYQQPITKGKKGGAKGAEPAKIGPFKFSYNELVKKGVLVDSEVPVLSRKKTSFLISSDEPGVFDISARVWRFLSLTKSLCQSFLFGPYAHFDPDRWSIS